MTQRARSAIVRWVTARPWVSVLVAVVLVGAGTGTAFLVGGADSSSAASTGTTERLVSVSTGTVRESVSTTGTFTPADEESVSFGSSATVTAVRVAQGDTVAKGDVLGTIATVTLKAAVAQAKADLATAQANLASAQDSDDTTDAQLAADKAGVTSARSSVTDAQDALDNATLVAPISGTIAEVNVSVGDTTSGSSSSGSAGAGAAGGQQSTATTTSDSADFVVLGMKKWTVSAAVDDTQVGLIKRGDQVQLTTDNVTGTVFGTVSSVSVLSSSDSGSASYPVEIAVTGSPSGLHDGASATASIIYKQVANVLTVASTAVHTDRSTSYVYVDNDGSKVKKTVTIGLSSDGTTQITKGLTSGQQVYVETVTGRAGSGSSTGQSGEQQQGGFPGGTGGFPGGTGGLPGGAGGFPGGGGTQP